MKYLLLLFLFLVSAGAEAKHAAAAAQPSSAGQKIMFSGGDGSSMDQAIVIESAEGEIDWDEAEYSLIGNLFPGFKLKSKGIVKKGGKQYDHLLGVKADGTKAEFYFDITLFADKM